MNRYVGPGGELVRARKWGPSWESMRRTSVWLISNGVPFVMNPNGSEDLGPEYQEWPKRRMPTIRVYDGDMNLQSVSVGDYIVVLGRNRVRIVPSRDFNIGYQEIHEPVLPAEEGPERRETTDSQR